MSDVRTVQRAIVNLPSLADIPAEIRFQIYDAINESRLVEMHYDSKLSSFWTPTKVPMGLHICHESRRETKARYQLCFPGLDGVEKVWFDFERDALYFGMYSLQVPTLASLGGTAILFEADEGRLVRHLAVHAEVMKVMYDHLIAELERYPDDPMEAHLLLLPEFHTLEVLTIVGTPGTKFIPDKYKIMFERAKEEELWGWKFPEVRYVIDTPQGYIAEVVEDKDKKKKVFGGVVGVAAVAGDVTAGPATALATDTGANAGAESTAEPTVEPSTEPSTESTAENAAESTADTTTEPTIESAGGLTPGGAAESAESANGTKIDDGAQSAKDVETEIVSILEMIEGLNVD